MTTGENRFVFVVPMFNAAATFPRMLHSVYGQSYDNWKLVVIDDVSVSRQWNECLRTAVSMYEASFGLSTMNDRLVMLHNDKKRWEVANVLDGMKRCESNDIVCRLDADDWLTDLDALAIIDSAYKQTGCDALWTAHRWGFSDKNISAPMLTGADPYVHPWVSSHLKTWRMRLSEGVNDVNYRGEDGEYIRRAGDQAIYLPVLARATNRAFLSRCMYHYTINDVPETYQTSDARFQRDEALFLRSRGYVS